jgi:lipid A ethanolaminephosphotransferase
MRNHKQLRYLINPLNSVYALGMVATEPLRRTTACCCRWATDARWAPAMPGHQAAAAGAGAGRDGTRGGNFSLNGYARPTTPSWPNCR